MERIENEDRRTPGGHSPELLWQALVQIWYLMNIQALWQRGKEAQEHAERAAGFDKGEEPRALEAAEP